MDNSTEFIRGPTESTRFYTQITLFSILLVFGILTNGCMLTIFVRFKSLRAMTNYLLIDLTIVESLDILVNIPLFMEFFLLTKKKNLDRQTRWIDMLLHRYFLINDLVTQFTQSVDCFLAIKFGGRYTSKKTTNRLFIFIALKWLSILSLLLVFSIPNYQEGEEMVSDEAYQRLLFGPNQLVWKAVIPSFQASSVIAILMTNHMIAKSRRNVSKRYGMKVFGRGSKNSSKAVNTLFLIMGVQTLCKVPAMVYSYIAVDDRVEGNRWFAFAAYFCLYLSSCIMPLIYFTRTIAFNRALFHFRKHPFTRSAWLDYAAQNDLKMHRNGRLLLSKVKTVEPKKQEKSLPEELCRDMDFVKYSTITKSSTTQRFSITGTMSIDTISVDVESAKGDVPHVSLGEEAQPYQDITTTDSEQTKDDESEDESAVSDDPSRNSIIVTAQVHQSQESISSDKKFGDQSNLILKDDIENDTSPTSRQPSLIESLGDVAATVSDNAEARGPNKINEQQEVQSSITASEIEIKFIQDSDTESYDTKL